MIIILLWFRVISNHWFLKKFIVIKTFQLFFLHISKNFIFMMKWHLIPLLKYYFIESLSKCSGNIYCEFYRSVVRGYRGGIRGWGNKLIEGETAVYRERYMKSKRKQLIYVCGGGGGGQLTWICRDLHCYRKH